MENETNVPNLEAAASNADAAVEKQPVQTPAEEAAGTENATDDTAIKPFELPGSSVPDEDFTAPETVLGKYKGDKQALYKAVAKDLGFDDFILRMNDHYQAQGSFDDYLKVMGVDWTKVSDAELLTQKLKEDYAHSKLPADKIQRLIEHKLLTTYGIGAAEEDTESVEYLAAQLQAERDAATYRQAKLTAQQQFQAPQRQEAPAPPSPQEAMQTRRNGLIADERAQAFLKTKTLAFGEYTHELPNAEETLSNLYDENRYNYNMAQKDESGKVVMRDGRPVTDTGKLLKMAAYAQDMDGIEKALIEYGRTLGKKQVVDEAEVVSSQNQQHGSEGKSETLLDALAKRF